jgi:hypothetical protein
MELGVICECGQCVAVQEPHAGSSVACKCGRPVVVPLLSEFEAQPVLLSAATIERRIRRMLAAKELPITDGCARCGDLATAQVVNAVVECERCRIRTTGGLKVLFIPIPGFHLIWWREPERTEEFGHDTDVPAPISLCPECWRHLGEPRVRPYALIAAMLAATAVPFFYLNVGLGFLLLAIFLVVPYSLHRRAKKRWKRALKELLRTVPVYGQLLDRYPYGVVRLPPAL